MFFFISIQIQSEQTKNYNHCCIQLLNIRSKLPVSLQLLDFFPMIFFIYYYNTF